MTTDDLIIKSFRLALALAAFGLVGWILVHNLPPSGVLSSRAVPGEANPFIGILRPENRVRLVTDGERRYLATGDPIYFQLAMPRLFRRAIVTLEYRASGQPMVELGPRISNDTWGFALKPLGAPILDESGWKARQDGPYRIYERRVTKRTAADLLASGDPKRLAVWHVDSASTSKFATLNWNTDLRASAVTTVVAGYVPPLDLGDGWKRAEATFERGEMALVRDEAQFALSLPAAGRLASAGPVEVRTIEVRYEREPWSPESLWAGLTKLLRYEI